MPSILQLQSALGRPLFTVAVALALLTVVLVLGMAVRSGARRGARIVAATGLLATLAIVLSLTLPGLVDPGVAPRRLFLDPVAGAWGWDGIAWRPVVDNVALFVPVGAFAAATFVRSRLTRILLGIVALSIGIETFQYLVPTGRVANSADVLANAAGAAVGIALATLLGTRPRTTDGLSGPGSRRRGPGSGADPGTAHLARPLG
ncbi:MAG: VanZ family protein [Nitriliruptoraceae bacterium]